MVIKARYEKGVFRPLEDLNVEEGTEADIYLRSTVRNGKKKPRKPLRDYEAFGMWADRKDFGDSVEYVNRLRQPRSKR